MRQRPTARTNVIITAGKGAKILFKNIQRTELNYYNRKKREKHLVSIEIFAESIYKKKHTKQSLRALKRKQKNPLSSSSVVIQNKDINYKTLPTAK